MNAVGDVFDLGRSRLQQSERRRQHLRERIRSADCQPDDQSVRLLARCSLSSTCDQLYW